MNKQPAFDEILELVKECELSGRELREFAMAQLDTLPTYDWSGIYVLDGEMLHLDAFVGAATDHTEIPVGRGVCGTAVAENKNQVI
jgi:L-methionine (R)-S-oxide reductase